MYIEIHTDHWIYLEKQEIRSLGSFEILIGNNIYEYDLETSREEMLKRIRDLIKGLNNENV